MGTNYHDDQKNTQDIDNIQKTINFIGRSNVMDNHLSQYNALLFALFYKFNFYIYKPFLNMNQERINKMIYHVRQSYLYDNGKHKTFMNLIMKDAEAILNEFKMEKRYSGKYEVQTLFLKDDKTIAMIGKKKSMIINPFYEIPLYLIPKKKSQIVNKVINHSILHLCGDENVAFKKEKMKINKFPKILILKINRKNGSQYCTNVLFPSFFLKKKLSLFGIIALGDPTNENSYTAFLRDHKDWYRWDHNNKRPAMVGSFSDLLTKFDSKQYVLEQSKYILYSEIVEEDHNLDIGTDEYFLNII